MYGLRSIRTEFLIKKSAPEILPSTVEVLQTKKISGYYPIPIAIICTIPERALPRRLTGLLISEKGIFTLDYPG